MVRLLQTVQGVGARWPCRCFRPSGRRTRFGDCDGRQGLDQARAGRWPKVAERLVIELKDKAPAYSTRSGVIKLSGSLAEKRAPQPILDAVSALVNLGYGQPQAAAAISAASRNSGEGATRRP